MTPRVRSPTVREGKIREHSPLGEGGVKRNLRFRVISWIVCLGRNHTIHEITLSYMKEHEIRVLCNAAASGSQRLKYP